LSPVAASEADLAWLIYDLAYDSERNAFKLAKGETVYTKFEPTMLKITTSEPGPIEIFIEHLQAKLDEKLDPNPPDVTVLTDDLLT
jgi:hypothetical protein